MPATDKKRRKKRRDIEPSSLHQHAQGETNTKQVTFHSYSSEETDKTVKIRSVRTDFSREYGEVVTTQCTGIHRVFSLICAGKPDSPD